MNALNAVVKGRVLVKIAVVNPRNAHAPTGNGLRTRPAIVDKKIDKSCQACGVTSIGRGIRNRTIKPIDTEITNGISLAPCETTTAATGAGRTSSSLGGREEGVACGVNLRSGLEGRGEKWKNELLWKENFGGERKGKEGLREDMGRREMEDRERRWRWRWREKEEVAPVVAKEGERRAKLSM